MLPSPEELSLLAVPVVLSGTLAEPWSPYNWLSVHQTRTALTLGSKAKGTLLATLRDAI